MNIDSEMAVCSVGNSTGRKTPLGVMFCIIFDRPENIARYFQLLQSISPDLICFPTDEMLNYLRNPVKLYLHAFKFLIFLSVSV